MLLPHESLEQEPRSNPQNAGTSAELPGNPADAPAADTNAPIPTILHPEAVAVPPAPERRNRLKYVGAGIAVLALGTALSVAALLRSHERQHEEEHKAATEARERLRQEERSKAMAYMAECDAAMRKEYQERAKKEWESALNYASSGDIRNVRECRRVISVLMGRRETLAEIGVTPEQELGLWRQAATALWARIQKDAAVERLEDLDSALASAQWKREDAGAAPETVKALYLLRAKRAWNQAVRDDREDMRSPFWGIHEMDAMLKSAGEPRAKIGVTDAMVQEIELHVRQRLGGERVVPKE
jgi:hypothetical protein